MTVVLTHFNRLAKVPVSDTYRQVQQARRVSAPSIDTQNAVEIDDLANNFVTKLNLHHRDVFAFKDRVVDFIYKRKTAGSLSQAMFFIRNLTDLASVRYEDGSSIVGVERVFENAEEAHNEGKHLNGFYFEPMVTLSLLENGYKIKELSARYHVNGRGLEKLISSDRKEREFDIIAQKNTRDKTVTFFIDAKTCIDALRASDRKNHQVDALVWLANKYDAVPIIVLRTKDPVITPDGKLMDYDPLSFSMKTNTDIADLLLKENRLLIWNEDGKDIISEKQLHKYKQQEKIKPIYRIEIPALLSRANAG